MRATHQHLNHLSTILNESGDLLQHSPLSEHNLLTFFDAIALDRIRISRTDWQGHSVNTLIGHLPNLKPTVKASLSRFIVDKWKAQAAGNMAPPTLNETDLTVPTVNHLVEKPLTTALVEKSSGIVPKQPCVSPATPVPRRDGFDRITDWVAALVSLWK